MLVFLLAYQYIPPPWQQRAPLVDDQTAVIPDSLNVSAVADGYAEVGNNRYYGHDILINGTIYWSEDVGGQYVCGHHSQFRWTNTPQYEHTRSTSIGGWTVWILLTLFLLVGMTGSWPVIYRMYKMLRTLVHEWHQPRDEEAFEVDDDGEPGGKSCSYHLVRVWFALATLAAVLASGLLAYLVVASSNVISLGENVAVGSCYFVRPTVGGLQARGLKDNNTGSLPPASVRRNTDGSVDFILNCEASMYQASTGAIWRIVPQYGITCMRTPAYHIKNSHIFEQTLCSGGSWKPDGRGGTPDGYSGSIEWGEAKTGMDCGLFGWGALWYRAWGSWYVVGEDTWQKCQKQFQPSYLTRTDEITGEQREVVALEQVLTVDPDAMGRQYGWYTNGPEEAVIHSTFGSGEGSSLLFFKPESWPDYMRRHFRKENAKLTWIPPYNLNVQPNRLECRALVRIPNGNDYTEFRQACTSVTATTTADTTAGITLSITVGEPCTVVVGYGSDDKYTTITLTTTAGVTLRGADRWRCSTRAEQGVDCGDAHQFEVLEAKIVEQSRNTTIEQGGEDGTTKGKEATRLDLSDLFGLGAMNETLGTVAMIVVLVIVAALIVWMIVCCCRRRRADTVIVAPPSAVT
jgi:hypothetical protein